MVGASLALVQFLHLLQEELLVDVLLVDLEDLDRGERIVRHCWLVGRGLLRLYNTNRYKNNSCPT